MTDGRIPMVVYIIVNSKNKTVYIGRSKNIANIRYSLKTRLKSKCKTVLLDWIRGLGLENIHVGLLDEDDTKMHFWIDKMYMNCIKRYSHTTKERRWLGE